MQHIGEIVKEKRKRKGWSQTVLGDFAGMSAATVHRIEYGEKIPTDQEAELLATALGLDVQATIEACENSKTHNNHPPKSSYKTEWDYAHPASYAGRVWIQLYPQTENRHLPHEYQLRWGAWEHRGTLVFSDQEHLSLQHYKYNDGAGKPLFLTLSHPCYAVVGRDSAPDQPPHDITFGWQRVEPYMPGQMARLLWVYIQRLLHRSRPI